MSDIFSVVAQGGDIAIFGVLWYCYKIKGEMNVIEQRADLQAKAIRTRIDLLERRVFHRGMDQA